MPLLDNLRGLYGMVDLPISSSVDVPLAGCLARQLLDGGVTILQLRMKGRSASEMLQVLDELRPLCQSRGATLIVNDRLDVALAGGADGVHLGQDDLPLAAARKLAKNLLIGISTHDEEQAERAANEGADYIGFGPIFSTRSKMNPDPVVGLNRLEAVCQLSVPVVAIGGISLERVVEVARTGARAVALISAVNGAPDVTRAAREVHSTFSATRRI